MQEGLNPDKEAASLRAALTKVGHCANELRAALTEQDEASSGQIDYRHFELALRSLSLPLSDGEIHCLFQTKDDRQDDRIDYNGFLRLIAFSDTDRAASFSETKLEGKTAENTDESKIGTSVIVADGKGETQGINLLRESKELKPKTPADAVPSSATNIGVVVDENTDISHDGESEDHLNRSIDHTNPSPSDQKPSPTPKKPISLRGSPKSADVLTEQNHERLEGLGDKGEDDGQNGNVAADSEEFIVDKGAPALDTLINTDSEVQGKGRKVIASNTEMHHVSGLDSGLDFVKFSDNRRQNDEKVIRPRELTQDDHAHRNKSEQSETLNTSIDHINPSPYDQKSSPTPKKPISLRGSPKSADVFTEQNHERLEGLEGLGDEGEDDDQNGNVAADNKESAGLDMHLVGGIEPHAHTLSTFHKLRSCLLGDKVLSVFKTSSDAFQVTEAAAMITEKGNALDGSIDMEHFAQAVTALALPLSDDDIQKVFNTFAVDNGGVLLLDYREFLKNTVLDKFWSCVEEHSASVLSVLKAAGESTYKTFEASAAQIEVGEAETMKELLASGNFVNIDNFVCAISSLKLPLDEGEVCVLFAELAGPYNQLFDMHGLLERLAPKDAGVTIVAATETGKKNQGHALQRQSKVKKSDAANVGGRVLPSPEVAATRIEASWRGKVVRRHNKLRRIAAVMIQTVVRSRQSRQKYLVRITRHRQVVIDDKNRRERLRRIQEREKELALLRTLPPEDYFNLERVRREAAKRVIVRFMLTKCRKIPYKNTKSSVQENPRAAELSALAKKQASIAAALRADASTASASSSGAELKTLSAKLEGDALGLAQLQRRVQEAARKRLKDFSEQSLRGRDSNMFRVPQQRASLFGRDDSENDFALDDNGGDLSRTVSNIRKKRGAVAAQQLLELQQTTEVWLSEYGDSKFGMMAARDARLKSIAHSKTLVDQLQRLPSLDEARAMMKAKKNPFSPVKAKDGSKSQPTRGLCFVDEDISGEGLEDAIAAHVRTMHAVTRRYLLVYVIPLSFYFLMLHWLFSARDHWNIVSLPHDMTSPPIDVCQLPSVAVGKDVDMSRSTEKNHPKDVFKRLASIWAEGKDAEESLWWVSFSAQLPQIALDVVGADGTTKQFDDRLLGKPSGVASEAAAQRMLGEVNAKDLLTRAAKDFLRARERRIYTKDHVLRDREREIRLAGVFTEEALSARRRRQANAAYSALTDSDKRRRHRMAVRIQSCVRGLLSRRLYAQALSEARMLEAIRVLLAEMGGGNTSGVSKHNKRGSQKALPGISIHRARDYLRSFKSNDKADQKSIHQNVVRPESPKIRNVPRSPTHQNQASALFDASPIVSIESLRDKSLVHVASAKHHGTANTGSATENKYGESFGLEDVGFATFAEEKRGEISQSGEKIAGYISPPTQSSLEISAFVDESGRFSPSPIGFLRQGNAGLGELMSPEPLASLSPSASSRGRKSPRRSPYVSPGSPLIIPTISKEAALALDSVRSAVLAKRSTLTVSADGDFPDSLFFLEYQNFNKDVVWRAIGGVVSVCGPVPLRRWLQNFCPVGHTGDGAAEDNDVLRLDLKKALLLLGGLACELKIVRSEEELGSLATMLRLLAASNESHKEPGTTASTISSSILLYDIYAIMEDLWLLQQPLENLSPNIPLLMLQIARCRELVVQQATKKHVTFLQAAKMMFVREDAPFLNSHKLASSLQNLGLVTTDAESTDLSVSMLSICTWTQNCLEAPIDKFVDYIAKPPSTFRQVQSKVHALCRKIPNTVRYYACNKDDKSTVSGLMMLEFLLNGPLPLTAFECVVLVTLLARDGRAGDVQGRLASIQVDQNLFLRICKGDILQAPLT